MKMELIKLKTDKKYLKLSEYQSFCLNNMSHKKKYRIHGNFDSYPESKIISSSIIDDRRYYLFTEGEGELFLTANLKEIIHPKTYFYSFFFKDKLFFFGILKYTEMKNTDLFDKVMLGDDFVSKINKTKLGFSHFSIDMEDIYNAERIHNNIYISNGEMRFSLRKPHIGKIRGIKYFGQRKYKDKLIIKRTAANGNVIKLTQIFLGPEYSRINSFKNLIGRMLRIFSPLFKINLLFEKETNKASESGYYIFEKLQIEENKKRIRSKNYFVIDKNSPDYDRVKQKYNKKIIEKFSLRYYIYIYLSKYFISSELSNHLVSARFYISSLNKVINRKPLIFLQHGIMFAKPVDNPAALGFWKKNMSVNVIKSVVSSDLEATQFYKMGYDHDDLIKCGLPKLDISFKNKDANKIVFMPTYRYWEEAYVYNNNMEATSYYKLVMNVLKRFEKEKLLENLLIVPHPKFAEYIISKFKKYEKNIYTGDVNLALEQCAIYITDYSSASYDAHFRGSYVIYYWKERDMLIENYKAIPPVNEFNSDGPVAWDMNGLIDEVRNAIKRKYKHTKKYENRFKKIVEFDDRKNYKRLIKYLKENNII